jgi:pimeloyl-ACP methyl ester carboxylesterase
MGGHAVTLAAALRPETFAGLVLVDPVILPAESYGARPLDAAFILRRRDHWASPGEMFDRFRARLPFAAWPEEVVRNYCDYGLLPEGGGYVLACPPAVEAAIYGQSNAPESNIYTEIATIRQPVTVLRAGRSRLTAVFDPAASPTAPDIASKFANCRGVFLAENNHFIPMEAPERVAEEIRRRLANS